MTNVPWYMRLIIAFLFLEVWFWFYGLLLDTVIFTETGLHYGELFAGYYDIYGVDAIGVVFLWCIPRLLLMIPISVPVTGVMVGIYYGLIDGIDDFLGKYGDICIIEYINGRRER